MDLLVKDRNLEYSFVNKTIIIAPKPPAPEKRNNAFHQWHAFRSGKDKGVSDAARKPLSGATAQVKRGRVSGITDEAGIVILNVKQDDVLVISFVGV